MSLLDDVSIVVTPNGYKAGELYAVIPVPTLGTELVDCSSFDCADPAAIWNEQAGWSFSGGKAIYDGTGGTSGLIQDNVIEVGKQYKVIVEVLSNQGSGSNTIYLGGTVLSAIHLSVGTHTFYGVTSNTNVQIYIYGRSGEVFEIGSVSVKEYTSADMDVTRSTAATRVDENGLVNYAEIIGSEEVTNGDFATDTDWDKTETWSIENNYATATANSASQYMQQDFTITNAKIYLFTYEIIENTLNGNGASLSGSGGFVSVSLSSAIGTHQVYITADDSGAAYALKIGVSGTATTGTIKLDNVSVKEVTRANVPRIDYTGGGCPHILAEPQRTNLVTYSEDFSQWSQIANTTLTANSTTSPSGDSDATKFLSTGGAAKVRENFSAVSGTTYTVSVYCKNIDSTVIKILTYDGVNSLSYDATSEVNTSTWKRISFTFTAANTGSGQIQIARDLPDTESAYFWGAQLEVGSYPTSYIPTLGGTVTRNQDIFTRDGISSLINSTEGVLFAEIAALSDDGTDRKFSISDGTSSNVISIIYRPTSNQVRGAILVGGVNQVLLSFVVSDATAFNKIAFKWKAGDFALWIGGVEVATSSSGSIPTGLNKISNDNGGGNFYMYSKVKQLQVFKTALTDSELATLTT